MGKFIMKATKTGFVFELKAGNGETIATSQVYSTKESCKTGIESVKANAAAEIEDQTVEGYVSLKHPKFEVYTDKAGETRFHLKARNGEIIAVSQAYKEKSGALKGIDSVRNNAPEALVEEEKEE
ncbi:MAG: YegP family protein [Eubacteriales bacterium]|nr:YegP family protein [Eubacteriales bacterium]